MASQPNPILANLASAFAQRLAHPPAGSTTRTRTVAPKARQIPGSVPLVRRSKQDEAEIREEAGVAEGPQNLSDVASEPAPIDLQRQAADMLDRLAHPEPAAQGMGGEALAHKVAGKGPKSEMERKRAETRLADQSGKVVAYPQSDERQHRGRKQ